MWQAFQVVSKMLKLTLSKLSTTSKCWWILLRGQQLCNHAVKTRTPIILDVLYKPSSICRAVWRERIVVSGLQCCVPSPGHTLAQWKLVNGLSFCTWIWNPFDILVQSQIEWCKQLVVANQNVCSWQEHNHIHVLWKLMTMLTHVHPKQTQLLFFLWKNFWNKHDVAFHLHS